MEIMRQILRWTWAFAVLVFCWTAQGAVAPAGADAWVALTPERFEVQPGLYRVPLHLAEPVGVERVREPARFGVPVPRGVLRDPQHVQLHDDRGSERPVQIEPAAYWPDGSYKWIILDTFLDLPAHGKATWQLSLGAGVARTEPQQPLRVSEDEEQVTIDTGVLKFVLLKERNEFIHAAWLDGNGDGRYEESEQVVAPPAFNETRGLFVDVTRVANAQRWRRGAGPHWAVIAPRPDTFKVEAAGPLCAEFLYEGWHHSETSADMDPWTNVAARTFRYVLRIRAYAGSSTLRVFHTFINTEDPNDIRVRSIGLRLPVTVAGKPTYTFGGSSPVTAPSDQPHLLIQEHWDSFRVERPGADAASRSVLQQGQTSEGWADLSGASAGLTVAFRDMVKLFPKELGFEGNAAIAYAWPAHKGPTKYEYFWGGNGSAMDLRHPNLLDDPQIQDFKTKHPDIYQRFMIGADSDWERYNIVPDRCSAMGVSKTHELLYDFHAGSVRPQRARDLTRALDDPIQPYVTPQWYCWATEAFGRTHPLDEANFPAMEAQFDRFIEWCRRHQDEWSRFWGMFDYGDFQTFHRPEGYPEEFGPWGKLMGRYGWLNGEYNNDLEFFLHYFRSGRYRDWKIARAFAAHRMDVDTCHHHPQPEWVGGQHRHSILHWSDWLIDQQTFNDGIAALYYATGDRRARDVALQVAEFSMFSNYPYWHDKYEADYDANRGSWTRLANIARAYEMNPQPRIRRHLERFIAMVEQHEEPFGGPRDGGGSAPYMGAAFPLAYRVTDSPRIGSLISRTGFTFAGGSVLGDFGPFFQLQYQLTGDTGLFIIGGITTAARLGTPEHLAQWRAAALEPGSYQSARNSALGYTYHMSATYDARYDDRLTAAPPATPPALPAEARYQMIDLRPVMNRDAFGHTASGAPLPWLPDGRVLGLRQQLQRKGDTLVFRGSAEASLSGDQNITARLAAGELPWTNWTVFPSTGLSLPVLRRNSPPPPLWTWGDAPFDIVDSRHNGGRSMIGVQNATVRVPINLQARKLHFLGHVFATRYAQQSGSLPVLALLAQRPVGLYRVHYRGGQTQEIPLINRVNMTPWIYGQAAPAAPFVFGELGRTANVWPGQGGVAAFTVEVDPARVIEAVEFIGTDANKELLLYAITAQVDGAAPPQPACVFSFNTQAGRSATQEVIAGLQPADEQRSGWLDSNGVTVTPEQTAVLLPFDGRMPGLRLRTARDGWHRVQVYSVSPHDSVRMTVFANGLPALNSRQFFAQARAGVIDLTFLCCGPIQTDDNTRIALKTVTLTPMDGAPPFEPHTLDPAELVQFGWQPPLQSGSGLMRDATLRIVPPPGRYRLTLTFTPFLGNTGVKLDLTPGQGSAIQDHAVDGKPAVLDLDSGPEGITVSIRVDPKTSSGRLQSWALDKAVLERLD
jgi:hypothetical protein